MARTHVSSDGILIHETGTRTYVSSGGGITNETESAGGATINLVGADTTQAATSGTGAVTVDPPASGTVNLVGDSTTQAATSGTGIVVITPAGTGLITTGEFRNWSNILLAGLTIPNVMIIGMDRAVVLSLANQVTNGAGVLAIAHASIAPGTDYMVATFNADGSARGLKMYTAT